MSLAPAFAACGESVHEGDSAHAGRGGASAGSGLGGTSEGGQPTAGRGSASAGAAGVIAAAGAGDSAGGSEARGGVGGSSATGGIGGVPQGGAPQGGSAQGGADAGGIDAGGADAGGADAGSCLLADPAQTCDAKVAYANGTIIDFSRYASDGTWTNLFGEVTGTTSLYHSSGASDVVLKVMDSTLHVNGTIPAGVQHAGWVFAFDFCVDGSADTGVTFVTNGDLGGATLTLAVETNADYPIDVSSGKGACPLIDCDTNESACKLPSALLPTPDSSFVSEAWSAFEGGSPESSVTPANAILGMKFDLTCPGESGDCVVDLTLAQVGFFGP